MDNSVYQPPKANLIVDGESQVQQLFYVVSKQKFMLLFFMTFGMYSVYWFWAHWHQWKQQTHDDIWPVPHAIFNIFFTHNLFSKITEQINQQQATANIGQPDPIDIQNQATIYVIASLVMNFSDRVLERTLGDWATLLTFLLLPVMAFALWQGQQQANIACGDIEGTANSNLTIWNYIWLVLGLLGWGVLVYSVYFMLIYALITMLR